MEPIPDHIMYNLKVLFVGFNPSIRSGQTGHHFANPKNRFWNILYRSGLIPYLIKPEEDYTILNYGYGLTNIVARPTKEAADYGYGLTNIVARPTKEAADISKEEYEEGRLILKEKIHYLNLK